MSNGLYLATNPGAILRRMFPKQLKSPLMIIVWTIVFILNIVLVFMAQNMFIYPYSDFTVEGMAEERYFENCKILSVNQMGDNHRMPGDYYVEYVDSKGNSRIVCLEAFPDKMFERARLLEDTDIAVSNGMVQYEKDGETVSVSDDKYVTEAVPEGMFDVLWQQPNHGMFLVGIYLAVAVIMLLIEFFLYEVFYRLFRE